MQKRNILHPGFFRGLLCLVVLAVYSSARADTASVAVKEGGQYRAPLMSEPVTLDPAYYTDIYSMQVASNLFDGLVEFDHELNVVPAIAERWKISPDHLTYTFLLHQGVKFHNGREVTAEDFVFSLTRLLDPQTESPAASFFMNIEGAQAYQTGKSQTISGLGAPDKYTLTIELEEPFAPFLSILGTINAKVLPKEAIGPDFARQPVGTGPFRFRRWKPGKEIVLEANEDYFVTRPSINVLTFRIYKNIEWEETFKDFQEGLIEHAVVPASAYETVFANGNADFPYKIVSKPGLNLVYVGMNTTLPPFDDVRVRQAFNYAVDTGTIVREITKRGTTPVKGILPPGVAGFDPDLRGFGHDPQKARELLAEAGYPDGRGFPKVAIWTVSKSESVQQELQAYLRYLSALGIQLEVRIAENWKAFVEAIQTNQAPLFYAAWYADYPDPDNFFYPLVYSKSKTNRMNFSDPKVDRLINEARTEIDYLKRVELYRTIERLVTQQAPLISQHANGNHYLFQPYVQNVEMNQLGSIYMPFRSLRLDRSGGVRHSNR